MAINEFGVSLDRNGYARSLFETWPNICWRCQKKGPTERHEIFGGARRNKSKELGLWVNLCGACHRTSPEAAHQSKETAVKIKSMAQRKAMASYGWDMEEWMRRFYKNYVLEE